MLGQLDMVWLWATAASVLTSAVRRLEPWWFERTGDATTSGDPTERASGNGSIMRLTPVPIHYASLFPDQLDGPDPATNIPITSDDPHAFQCLMP
jgi:hypothetical protein